MNLVNTNLKNDECIYKVWIHSYEEDDDTQLVYRSSSFDFPLSRGRDTFEIKRSGEIIAYSIGALDTYQKKISQFEIKDGNKLYVYPNKAKPNIMIILSCENDRLVIQKNYPKKGINQN